MTDVITAEFIVIGAGAAGSVVAHRLVEAGHRVLLLEAGGDNDVPAVHATDIGSMTSLWGECPQNWGHVTVPQHGLNGRSVPVAQGRGLGGGSAVNAMMYVRGNPADYDTWARLGATGWGWADVLPHFRKSEHYSGGDAASRGRSGPLSVIDYPEPSEAAQAFVAAAAEVGLSSHSEDYNGGNQSHTAFYYQSTRSDRDHRSSTATAFLDPLRASDGLICLTDAKVRKLIVEDGRVTGVFYRRGDQDLMARASREVILCAGAFATPHLLMMSGIGPSAHLRTNGIEVVQDLPGVGENLHDHLLLGLACQANTAFTDPQLLSEAGIFLHSGVPGAGSSPDLQFFFGPIFFADEKYRSDGPAFTFAPILAQPRSRGRVTLAGQDTDSLPMVDPNYLSDPADVSVLVEGLKTARQLSRSRALGRLLVRELAPGPDIISDSELADYVRASASTVWHPVGTCRMGADDDPVAVVDAQLRLRGVAGLRIADASVMPRITSGNTNAPTIMIGEKAAAMILSDAQSARSANATLVETENQF